MNWYQDNKDKIVILLLILIILSGTGFIFYWVYGRSENPAPVLIPGITMTQTQNQNKNQNPNQTQYPNQNQNPNQNKIPETVTSRSFDNTQKSDMRTNQQPKSTNDQKESIITTTTVSTNDQPLPKDLSISAFENKLITLVNDYRKSKGLNQLLIDKRLMQSAKNHNDLMAQQDTLSHELPGEPPLADPGANNDRYDKVGYEWKYAAENVAAGYQTPEQVMDGWINSPGHNANMLSVKSRDIGVAHNPRGNYWTQNFGNSNSPNQSISR